MVSRVSSELSEEVPPDEGPYGKGRLSRIDDTAGRTIYSYGADGQLVQQMSKVHGVERSTRWHHDVAGRQVAMDYPDGSRVDFGYDGYGTAPTCGSSLAGTWSTLADGLLYQPATETPYAWRLATVKPGC